MFERNRYGQAQRSRLHHDAVDWPPVPSCARALERTAYGGTVPTPMPAMVTVSPGARLIREWQGKTVAVLATEDGFVWEERTYRSLSQIAREVTGAHWSGPRFFGLTRRG